MRPVHPYFIFHIPIPILCSSAKLYCRLAVVVVSQMERLNPGPHEEPEQDQATSRLLESSNYPPPTTTDRDSSSHNINIIQPYADEQKAYTGYDDDDVHALNGTTYKSEQNPAVLWNGLPHYLLTGELLGIALSLCFLGTYTNPRATSWLSNVPDNLSSGSVCRFA
jgi:hypothetical protein